MSIQEAADGQLDSRAERGNAHNPRGCQAAAELGVKQQGFVWSVLVLRAVDSTGKFCMASILFFALSFWHEFFSQATNGIENGTVNDLAVKRHASIV